MRWFVDVSSIGRKGDAQTHCVEAESWQRALQAARALRSDPGPLTGFSIELLDDGFSALDPVKRLRYAIRKAPADAPLTTSVPATEPAASTTPSHVPPRPTPSHAPPRPAVAQSTPSEKPPAASPEPTKRPAEVEHAHVAPAGDTSPSHDVRPSKVPKAPSSRPPAPDLQLSPKPAAKGRTRSTPNMLAVPPPGTFPGLIEVITGRQQDPGPDSPLTYREYAYYVDGTPDWEEAEMLLRDQLEVVQQAISAAPKGKLVNLALFNVRFRGRPPLPPLATLTWKDWLGEPVVSFPESTAAAAIPLTLSKPSSRPPEPIAMPANNVEAVPLQAEPAATTSKPAPVAQPTTTLKPAPAAPAAPPAKPASVAPAPAAPAPLLSDAPPTAAPDSFAPPTSRGSDLPPTATAEPPVPKVRLRGDELIADLFEVMHDLQFLRDAVEGAEFCLALALEKMPARGGIVHLFDIDRREFVVTCAGGAGGESILLQRCAENDPVLGSAMRRNRPLVFADAQGSREVQSIGRYAALGGATSLIVAPVLLGGRFLGAIELLNPIDDSPFTDDDGHALSYIAEKLAAFVGDHGIQISRDQPAQPGRSVGAR